MRIGALDTAIICNEYRIRTLNVLEKLVIDDYKCYEQNICIWSITMQLGRAAFPGLSGLDMETIVKGGIKQAGNLSKTME